VHAVLARRFRETLFTHLTSPGARNNSRPFEITDAIDASLSVFQFPAFDAAQKQAQQKVDRGAALVAHGVLVDLSREHVKHAHFIPCNCRHNLEMRGQLIEICLKMRVGAESKHMTVQ
jgi:hypothetical protein